MPATSTVSEDTVTNTWHFSTTGWTETIRGAIAGALQAVYESIDAYKSNAVAWSSSRVKFFDLSEPEPRVPLADISLGLSSAPAGNPLPPEVAVCLSYRSDYASGASQQRRRGRIYMPPLNTAAITTDGRLGGVNTALATGAGTFLAASAAAADWTWVVWSPTAGQAYNVVAGWVDNAPDIQRRRGVRATVRTLF